MKDNYLFALIFHLISIHSKCSQIESNVQNTTYFYDSSHTRTSRALSQKPYIDENSKKNSELNITTIPSDVTKSKEYWEQIYGKFATDQLTRREQLAQMSSWLSHEDSIPSASEMSPYIQDKSESQIHTVRSDDKPIETINKNLEFGNAEALKSDKMKTQQSQVHHKSVQALPSNHQNHKSEPEEADTSGSHNSESNEDDNGPSGTTKTPPCAHYGRYYCSYKEDYPIKVVTEVTKYYKWPLEKLFRDLKHQVMPTLANDNSGGLVCDSITRIVRPGWSKNTNGRWLVVINTDHHQQYVTEVICRHGSGSYCNFIPPCYHASCRQRYNTQKLLVIDPWNPYKGPFLSEFLFPSCCVCYIPGDENDSSHSVKNTVKDKLTGIHTNHQSYSDKASSLSAPEVSSQSFLT